jgi:hypothetical protein
MLQVGVKVWLLCRKKLVLNMAAKALKWKKEAKSELWFYTVMFARSV